MMEDIPWRPLHWTVRVPNLSDKQIYSATANDGSKRGLDRKNRLPGELLRVHSYICWIFVIISLSGPRALMLEYVPSNIYLQNDTFFVYSTCSQSTKANLSVF